MDPSELQATIEAAKAGRSEGYQAILAAYGSRLYGYFYRATGDRHDAEDLLSEVMLRLVRMLPGYDERGRFEPWLFRIAANLVRDRIRRRRAAPANFSLSAEPTEGFNLEDTLAADDEPVETDLLSQEASKHLLAALEQLDEGTRQMILLRHFAGMTFAEISDMMDCPLGTALAKVHRGLKALRAKLERSYGQ